MIALVDVQVVLNRLSWQRVWSIPPAESAVSALTWRPDGRGVYNITYELFLSISCATGYKYEHLITSSIKVSCIGF